MFSFLPPSQTPVPFTRHQRYLNNLYWEQEKKYLLPYLYVIGILFLSCFIVSSCVQKSQKVVTPTLQEKICTYAKNSVLCDDKTILQRMERITKKKGVPLELVIGIAYAESTIHTNYNKPICKQYNNLWGLKGYKRDNGKLDWYDNKHGHDDNGCWLYKFESIEQGTEAISNTLSMGYKGCKYDTRCISYDYVGKPDVAEESWISRVSLFYTPKEV